MSLIYKKGSLFDSPKGTVLVHACNSQGVWGKGIAVEFKKRFPISYEMYRLGCNEENATGLGIALPEENGHRVGCLITSKNYDGKKDPIEVILTNTKSALQMILTTPFQRAEAINSNKFNSGLFGVPWEKTEKVLLDTMEELNYTNDWTIWSLQ